MGSVLILNRKGSLLVQVLLFAGIAGLASVAMLNYIMGPIKEQQANSARAMAEIQAVQIQMALNNKSILHSSVRFEEQSGKTLQPQLLACARQYAEDVQLPTDLTTTADCTTTDNNPPVLVPMLIYKADGTLAYPDGDAGTNRCVLDRTLMPCNCGSTAECRWRVDFFYNLQADYSRVSLTARVSYVPGGAVPNIVVAPRTITTSMAMSSFLVEPNDDRTCDPATEYLQGYTNELNPICKSLQDIRTACGAGQYPYGMDEQGNFLCRNI